MADGPLVERLREYLKDLSPEARALLMTELERGVLRGADMPGAELVLQELRRDARDARPKRPGTLARLFFRPLEPVLVDDIATHDHPGRITRVVLDPVWEWICRDLMPGEAKAVTEQVARAFEKGEAVRAEDLARAFQDRAVIRIEETLAAAKSDDRIKQRLLGQIRTPRAIYDVSSILAVMKARDTLAPFASRLPGQITTFDDRHVAATLALIESPAAGGPALFPYALVMTMNRLAAPWQLIRLATHAAKTDDASRIATTPYAVTVDIVMAETQRMTGELKAELRSGRGLAVGALLKNIHDALRGLRTELVFAPESAWRRRLAALQAQASDILKGEIETLPARIRRILRPRPVNEIAPNSTIDQNDVRDIAAQIAFVKTCRAYAAELALGELTALTWSEIEHDLDTLTAELTETLRLAGESDRPFRQSQLAASERFCCEVFGEDYAALLFNARDAAGAVERKAAKG